MSGIVHHLVSRGFEEAHQQLKGFEHEGKSQPISPWKATSLVITLIFYMLAMFAIDYTYSYVVATLAMVETPMVIAFKLDTPEADNINPFVPSDDLKKPIVLASEPEVPFIKSIPITAKIRTTMKHLRTQAGPWSRFRGLHIYMIYHFLFFMSYACLQYLFRLVYIPRAVAAITTHAIVSQWGLMWTQVVISIPSTQPWYKRIPTFATAKLVLLPTVIFAGAEQLVIFVSRDLLKSFGLHRYVRNPELFADLSPDSQRKVLAKISTIGLISVIAGFLVLFPAYVSLTRVYASALPEQDESIVPFDRTFGGRVQPRSEGGNGIVSMLDAWRTFDWAARIRLIKLFAKIFAIEFATTLFFGGLMLAQLFLILGRTWEGKQLFRIK